MKAVRYTFSTFQPTTDCLYLWHLEIFSTNNRLSNEMDKYDLIFNRLDQIIPLKGLMSRSY